MKPVPPNAILDAPGATHSRPTLDASESGCGFTSTIALAGGIASTANSAVVQDDAPEPLVRGCWATANALPEQLADGWHVLAPFGEFPEPGGRYVQVFGASQADAMIRSWNSVAGRSFRWLKNVRHRLKPSLSMPVFDAPPGAAHLLRPCRW
jgi:hypothetical protein